MQDAKLIVVQSYGSRIEAELAKGALEDSGIQSMIQADTAGGMREHLAWSGAGFRVVVREEDATIARDVLTPVESDESPDAEQTDLNPPESWPVHPETSRSDQERYSVKSLGVVSHL
jgi:hypothetical protein